MTEPDQPDPPQQAVRLHLRGGQTITTRATKVVTTHRAGGELLRVDLEGQPVDVPQVHYVAPGAVDVIEVADSPVDVDTSEVRGGRS